MASLNGKVILIIDDSDDVRLLARKILEGDGGQVFDAVSVDAGLELARHRIPHLILTDIEMPDKSGFDLLEIRHVDQRLKSIPTLVLSGKKDQASVVKAIALGASDYIVKPLRASVVLQKVRKALNLTSFYSRKTPDKTLSAASCSVSADILRISEVGCLLESAIKLPPEEELQLKSEILDQLGVDKVLMRTLSHAGRYTEAGRYLTEVNFIGINQELAKKVRAKLGE